jgi:hypothetical protein
MTRLARYEKLKEMCKETREGRPSLISKKLIDDICKNIARGMPLDFAAARIGITQPSYLNWMKRGEEKSALLMTGDESQINDEDKLYIEFFMAIKSTQSEFICENLKKIKDSEQWQSAAWMLERLYQKTFVVQKDDSSEDNKKEQSPVNIYLNDVKVNDK